MLWGVSSFYGGGELSLTLAVNGGKMTISEIQDGLHKNLWFSSVSGRASNETSVN